MIHKQIFGDMVGSAFDIQNREKYADMYLEFRIEKHEYSLTGEDILSRGTFGNPRSKGFVRDVNGIWINSEEYDQMFLQVYSKIDDLENKGNTVACENLGLLSSRLYKGIDDPKEISSLIAGVTTDKEDIWPALYHSDEPMFDCFREYYKKLRKIS